MPSFSSSGILAAYMYSSASKADWHCLIPVGGPCRAERMDGCLKLL